MAHELSLPDLKKPRPAAEAGRITGANRRQIRAGILSGDIPTIRYPGCQREYVTLEAVYAWLDGLAAPRPRSSTTTNTEAGPDQRPAA